MRGNMTKNEFMNYVNFVATMTSTKIPKEKETLAAIYEYFEEIPFDTGKAMVNLFIKNENGFFSWAALLKYKDLVRSGYQEKKKNFENCKSCRNGGFVMVETIFEGKIYEKAYRCSCSYGKEKWSGVKDLTPAILKGKELGKDGVWKIKKELLKVEQ